MTKMKTGTYKYIEQLLMDYPQMGNYIAKREEELYYPAEVELDQNIGGGRSSFISQPTERMAITIVEDKRLRELARCKGAIDKLINESDFIMVGVIQMFYFQKPRLRTWEGIAMDTGLSERHCRRLRDKFFLAVADELGMPI